MVRDPGQQARLLRAHARVRPDGGVERRDLSEGRRRGARRRLAALRLDVAARRQAAAARRDLRGRAPGRDVQRRLQGRARAHPDEEHRLRGRAGGAARDGHRCPPRAAAGKVRPQAGADGLEPEGRGPGLRLRQGQLRLPAADSPRAHGRHQGLDPDRRQHRRRPGLRLRRRDRRRLVPDHAGDVADGGLPRLLPEVPHRSGDEEEPLRGGAGRGRAGRGGRGDRRRAGPARGRSRRRRAPASR